MRPVLVSNSSPEHYQNGGCHNEIFVQRFFVKVMPAKVQQRVSRDIDKHRTNNKQRRHILLNKDYGNHDDT
jgi:hypothetical protein